MTGGNVTKKVNDRDIEIEELRKLILELQAEIVVLKASQRGVNV